MAAEGLFLLTHSLGIDTSHSTRRGIDPALLPRLRIVEAEESPYVGASVPLRRRCG